MRGDFKLKVTLDELIKRNNIPLDLINRITRKITFNINVKEK